MGKEGGAGSILQGLMEVKTDLEPFVDAFGVILVAAGEDSQRLAGFKLAHADDAGALTALFDLTGEPVGRQLVDLRPRQSPRLGLAQSLGQVQQRLVVLRFDGVGRRSAHQIRSVVQRRIRQHGPESYKKTAPVRIYPPGSLAEKQNAGQELIKVSV